MSDIERCPRCDADLRGEPIPEANRHLYGSATHFRRTIGHDGGWLGIYDGVIAWSCPDCGAWWHRFPEGDRRRPAVQRAMAARS